MWMLATVLLLLSPSIGAFAPHHRDGANLSFIGRPSVMTRLCSTASSAADPTNMKLSDIKTELQSMGVSFTDCFDRESLTRRLVEARNGEIPTPSATDETAEKSPSKSPAPSSLPVSATFDREATLEALRSLSVKELRTEMAGRNLRWANAIEKEDLVQALLKAREVSHNFSPSGALSPNTVADITADQLSVELSNPVTTPLLLDVYATWCGPCQMVAPQLVAAAQELGDSVRVAKIDSDKYPEWSSRLKVGGLPTLILFDGTTGDEVERIEGALMKDGLLEFARRHL